MEYCINTLLSQGLTNVPQWGQGHPYEIKNVRFERTSSSSSTNSYASAKGMMGTYYLTCSVTMTTDDNEAPKVVLPVMSSKEEAQLLQLRQKLLTVLKEDHFPNDLVLWRFLRARDNNVDKVRCNDVIMMSL